MTNAVKFSKMKVSMIALMTFGLIGIASEAQAGWACFNRGGELTPSGQESASACGAVGGSWEEYERAPAVPTPAGPVVIPVGTTAFVVEQDGKDCTEQCLPDFKFVNDTVETPDVVSGWWQDWKERRRLKRECRQSFC